MCLIYDLFPMPGSAFNSNVLHYFCFSVGFKSAKLVLKIQGSKMVGFWWTSVKTYWISSEYQYVLNISTDNLIHVPKRSKGGKGFTWKIVLAMHMQMLTSIPKSPAYVKFSIWSLVPLGQADLTTQNMTPDTYYIIHD